MGALSFPFQDPTYDTSQTPVIAPNGSILSHFGTAIRQDKDLHKVRKLMHHVPTYKRSTHRITPAGNHQTIADM